MITVTKDSAEWSTAIDKVFALVEDLPNDKLKNNYSKDNLKIHEWLAISYYDGGFSTIAHRDIWGNNCRILNRFYKNPKYRFENTKRKLSQETFYMIQQQLEVAKNLNFDCAFMSRETKLQAWNHFKKYLPQEWHTPNERHLMYNNGYQHIMWTPLNSNNLVMEKE